MSLFEEEAENTVITELKNLDLYNMTPYGSHDGSRRIEKEIIIKILVMARIFYFSG